MSASELPKARRVLLLVDVINPMNFPEAPMLAPPALEAARAIARLRRALGPGVPAIYANDNFGNWRSDFRGVLAGVLHGRGPGATIAKLLQPRRTDVAVLKPKHSAFYGSPLDILLSQMGAKQLCIVGFAADICVQLTAMDAFLRGYRLRVPADCVASETEEKKMAALAYMSEILRADVLSHA